jgi:hypothetical protein
MKEGIYVDSSAMCDSFELGKWAPDSRYEFATIERKENNIVCNALTCKYNHSNSCVVNHLNIDKTKQEQAKCTDYNDK